MRWDQQLNGTNPPSLSHQHKQPNLSAGVFGFPSPPCGVVWCGVVLHCSNTLPGERTLRICTDVCMFVNIIRR